MLKRDLGNPANQHDYAYVGYLAVGTYALEQMTQHSFPESIQDTVDYLGVDPAGKRTKADMDYAARMDKVMTKMKFSGSKFEFVSDVIRESLAPGAKPNPITQIQDAANEASFSRSLYARMEKLTPDEKDKAKLLGLASTVGQNALAERERMLEVLEYGMGLSEKRPSDEQLKATAQILKTMPQTLDEMADYNRRKVPLQPEGNISIHFANFENTLAQRYVSHPDHIREGIDLIPNDYKNPDVAMRNAKDYVVATVAPTMDVMFGGVEEKHKSAGSAGTGINRGSLLIVDGKTVAERMQELYNVRGGEKAGYKSWYKENLTQMTNEIVGAALTAGKKVSALFVDEHGKVNSEPTPIVREGYEPTPLKPVSMRGWHRMWNRVGLYKERKMAHDAYVADQLEQASMDAAVVRAKAVNTNAVRDGLGLNSAISTFYTEIPQKRGVDRGLAVDRIFHLTGPRSILLSQGHSVADVFNPYALKEEKLAAGVQYLDMVDHPTDAIKREMGAMYGIAAEKMTDFLADAYAGCTLEEIRNKPNLPLLTEVAQCSADLSQNAGCKIEYVHGMVEACAPSSDKPYTDEEASKLFDEIQEKAFVYQHVSNYINKHNEAMASIGTDLGSLEAAAISTATMADLSNLIDDRMQAQPGKLLSDVVSKSEISAIAIVNMALVPEIQLDELDAAERATLSLNLSLERCDFSAALNTPISKENLSEKERFVEGYARVKAGKAGINAVIEKATGHANQKSKESTRKEISLSDLMPTPKEPPKRQAKQQEPPQKTAQKGGRGK